MGGLFSIFSRKSKAEDLPIDTTDYSKIAICYSYIGTGYTALEFLWSDVNVENVVMGTLVEAKLVPPNAFNNLARLEWQSAISTEPGTHAACQVLSVLVPKLTVSHEKALRRIQANLISENVCFWGIIESDRRFNAKRWCEVEHFTYLLPKSVLGESDFVLRTLDQVVFLEFLKNCDLHNYTDTPCRTRIEKIFISGEYSCDGVDLVAFSFAGCGFKHKQIRRIMSVFIAVARHLLSIDQVRATLTDEKWSIPEAPEACLFLDYPEFPYYMRGMRRRPDLTKPDVEFKKCRPQIAQWKTSVLVPHIASLIKSQNLFTTWLEECLKIYPVL